MTSNKAFAGVGVAGMSRTLHAAEAAATAHPAFWAYPVAVAVRRLRCGATATGQSVDRGTT